MLPKVLAGCLIAAFITMLLPRDMVGRWVGAESGIKGILISRRFAGIILPGGPFTIFPIAAAFLAVGADVGAAIALITSWTLLGINRALVWEMPFFGFDFVVWRSLAALPLPIVAGLLARLIARLWLRAGRGSHDRSGRHARAVVDRRRRWRSRSRCAARRCLRESARERRTRIPAC